MSKAKITYTAGLQFVAQADSGSAIVMDGDAKFGGGNSGPRPMELLLIGLGGCSGMDVVSILKKKREKVMAKMNRISAVHWILVRITALSSS